MGKCVYNVEWEEEYGWLAPVTKQPHDAKCTLCGKTFSIAGQGISQVRSHAKAKKHQEREARSVATVRLDTIFTKTSSDSTSQPVAAAVHPSPPSSNSLTSPAAAAKPKMSIAEQAQKANDVSKAEILWALQAMNTHQSNSSQSAISTVFAAMFPDSAIAQKFSVGETKMRYLVKHGLAPYFKDLLLGYVKNVPWVLMFDESLNKATQQKQLDVMVRFWDPKKNLVVSRYWTSVFMGHATAADLMSAITSSVKQLPLCAVLQLSMDGPYVNWSLYENFELHMKDNHNIKLLNTGSCGLHQLHGAFMLAVKATDWRVADLLQALYTLMKNTPARREDYTDVTGSKVFPQKYCKHRWLDNGPALQRAIDVMGDMALYVKAVKSKKKKDPKTKSFDTVAEATNDVTTNVKLLIVQSVAGEVEPFLRKYQTDAPMLPFLAVDLRNVLYNIMKRFQTLDSLLSASPRTISKKKLDRSEEQLEWRHIDLGFAANKAVKLLRKSNAITDRDMMNIYMEAKSMMKAFVQKLQDKSPLKFSVVLNAQCLDPRLMASNRTEAVELFENLLWAFVQAKRIKACEGEGLKKQFVDFLDDVVVNQKFVFINFNVEETRLDEFFHLQFFDKLQYAKLFDLIKQVLTLSHGQAAVERGFSVNKECLQDNMDPTSVTARRVVLDHIRSVGGVLRVDIDSGMKASCRMAYSRYKLELESKKGESEESKKRKLEEEKEVLRKKRATLQQEMERIEKEMEMLN